MAVEIGDIEHEGLTGVLVDEAELGNRPDLRDGDGCGGGNAISLKRTVYMARATSMRLAGSAHSRTCALATAEVSGIRGGAV